MVGIGQRMSNIVCIQLGEQNVSVIQSSGMSIASVLKLMEGQLGFQKCMSITVERYPLSEVPLYTIGFFLAPLLTSTHTHK